MDSFERKIVKVNDSLYSIEEGFVRWFVLIGEDKAAVIDTGVMGAGVLETVKYLTDKEPVLINTHGDGDHTAGNGFFESFYINENDYINCGMAERCPDAKPVFVADGQEVDLGNRILELIHIPGHTKGSVAIYDKKSKALFAGDTVQDGFVYMFGGHRDTDAYGKSLEKLIAKKNDIDVYYACHGTLELPNDYPEKMLEDWKKTLAGECPYEEMNLHGQDVKAYKESCCGFFLQ